MPVINRIAEYFDEMKGWRRHLHAHPELDLKCHETAAFVVDRLREFGVDEIHEGIAETGVVAIINGRGEGPTIGLRADMDALPIVEATGAEHTSQNEGVMHACGHDGHTTMLLGAAKYLTETRNFSGRVALIFQPAEETIGGARIMCEEGLLERFDIGQVYAVHTWPDIPVGDLHTCPGPMLAAADDFEILVTGKGGHAAMPELAIDPLMAAVQMVQSLQSIVTRNVDPIDTVVLSVSQFHAGETNNVIADHARMSGTVRTFSKSVRAQVFERMHAVVEQTAAAFGAKAEVTFIPGYPATVNDFEETEFACKVADEVVGPARVERNIRPSMGSEDFSFMLERSRGSYIYVGNGDSAGLHHPEYDFNDEASPVGATFFVRLVETAQPV
ncbi:MAG: amidohydrolase [Rhodobacteraceae bacterium]|nr:amidohydrolase [Paracoccaceae bacterium]